MSNVPGLEKFIELINNYVFISVGATSWLHKDIDNSFKKDEDLYYKSYLSSELTKIFSGYINKGHYADILSIHKLIGISQHELNTSGNLATLMTLIKKGFKHAYRYFSTYSGKSVSLDAYSSDFMKSKGGPDSISDSDQLNACVCFLWLCINNETHVDLTMGYGQYFVTTITQKISESKFSKALLTEEYGYKSEMPVDKDQLEKYWSVSDKETSVAKLIEGYNVREVAKLKKEAFGASYFEPIALPEPVIKPAIMGLSSPFDISRINTDYIEKANKLILERDKVISRIPNRFYAALNFVLAGHDLDLASLTDRVSITKEEMRSILAMRNHFNKMEPNCKQKDEELDLFVAGALVVKTLADSYNELKKNFMSFSEETLHYEREKIKAESMKTIDSLSQEVLSLRQELDKLKINNSALIEEVSHLKFRNRDLEQQINKIKSHSKEVIALRNFVFSLSEEDSDLNSEKIPFENKISLLKTKKCAIIGGHTNFLQKLQTLLPNFIFISLDEANRDFTKLNNIDHIFIYVYNFNHGMYRKLMSNLNKSVHNIFYLKKNVNSEKVVDNMFENFSKSSN